MTRAQKATRIEFFTLASVPMRTFHTTWATFFVCFFVWFGIAPLMAVVREDLALSQEQIGNTIIASAAVTVPARVAVGWLADRLGPRLIYTWLLALGALPVMTLGLVQSYEQLLLCRLAIGAIGSSFVLTQLHTTLMFDRSCVGTATATTAGWGNLGAGAAQLLMPLLFAGLLAAGLSRSAAWRLEMFLAGGLLLVMAVAYHRFTLDTPAGDYPRPGPTTERRASDFRRVAVDYRVWVLGVIYGACFGLELTIYNVGALYFFDRFELSLAAAGAVVGLFGLMNGFARAAGGFVSDRIARTRGLSGRTGWLGVALLGQGLSLVAFSRMDSLLPAIILLVVFSILVKMAQGATYAVVPFVNERAVGSVAGIVGAGGTAGAVAAGFLFRSESLLMHTAFLWLGIVVIACAALALTLHLSEDRETRVARPVSGLMPEPTE